MITDKVSVYSKYTCDGNHTSKQRRLGEGILEEFGDSISHNRRAATSKGWKIWKNRCICPNCVLEKWLKSDIR